MLLVLFLTFCRAVIGIVFAISFLNKIKNITAFQTTIANFHLLPKSLINSVAILFLLGELTVTFCMVMGGNLLGLGFSLAFFLLVVFTLAMVTVLARRIKTSCNCFGTNSKKISFYDIARNAGFIACAIGGWGVFSASGTMLATLNLPELVLVAFIAVTFLAILTHLAEIVGLFRLT
jgi:hypothetical protein